MPFTLAHPAAVLAFGRCTYKHLPLSALVVGSMSPDFEYLLRLQATSKIGHSLIGVFTFCVPVGFVSLLLFHKLIKHPLVFLLPRPINRRLLSNVDRFKFLPWHRFLVILVSLLIGAITHVIWDSATHASGFIVQRVQIFSAVLINVAGQDLRVYKALQHMSTVAGLSVLTYKVLKCDSTSKEPADDGQPVLTETQKYYVLATMGLIIFGCGLINGYIHAGEDMGTLPARVFVVQSAIGGMTAFCCCILIFAIVFRLVHAGRLNPMP